MGDRYLSVESVRRNIDYAATVSPVTNSVYKITDSAGANPRYAKVWQESKRTILKDLSSIEADIGMPEFEVIDGEKPIQVMEPIRGRLLLSRSIRTSGDSSVQSGTAAS